MTKKFEYITVKFVDLNDAVMSLGYNNRDKNDLRMGQLFINQLKEGKITGQPEIIIFPELFYQEDKYKCLAIILDNFTIDYQKSESPVVP